MKKRIVIAAIILAILSFGGLIFLQNKINNQKIAIKVVHAKENIKIGTRIDSSNIELRDKYIDLGIELNNVLYSLDFVEGEWYAAENIYKDEILNKKRLTQEVIKEEIEISSDQTELAISFSELDSSMGGLIRKNDIIDIFGTFVIEQEKQTNVIAEDIKVLRTMDGTGNEITTEGIATTFIIAVTPEEASQIINTKNKGDLDIIRKKKALRE